MYTRISLCKIFFLAHRRNQISIDIAYFHQTVGCVDSDPKLWLFTFLLLKYCFTITSFLGLIKKVKEGSNLFIQSLGETVSDFLTCFRFVFNWNCVKAVRNSIHASITKLTVYVEIFSCCDSYKSCDELSINVFYCQRDNIHNYVNLITSKFYLTCSWLHKGFHVYWSGGPTQRTKFQMCQIVTSLGMKE